MSKSNVGILATKDWVISLINKVIKKGFNGYSVAFINKPNLWEPGKEYDFGDGVYGQRFTGSVTHTAAHTSQIVELTSTIPDSLISSGGKWYRGSTAWTYSIGQTEAISTSGAINLSSTIAIVPKRGLLVKFYNNSAQTSTYDIWVKYTK